MRKTIVLTGATLLLAASLLFLPGCSSPLQSTVDGPGQATNDGSGQAARTTGTVTLTIGQNLARTILPDVDADDFDRFYLTFTRVDAAGTYSPDDPWATSTGPVTLPFGTWNLHVYAYLTSACDDPSAEGTSTNFILGADNLTANVSVALEPISDPTADEGTFSWTVDISGITTGLTSANIAIVNLDGNVDAGTHPLDGLSSHLLDPGQYRVTLTIIHADYGTMILSEILHVFSNLTSTWELGPITSADFTEELVDVVIGALGNLTAAGITAVHFGLLEISITSEQFAVVNTHAPYLAVDPATTPSNTAQLEVLVDAALARGLSVGPILTALPAAREGLFDAVADPRNTPMSTAAAWTDPSVTVRVGAASPGFGYDVTFAFNLPEVTVTADGASLIVGSDLTANTTTITDVIAGLTGFSFIWERSADGSAGWTVIVGQSGNTYTLAAPADVGQYIRVLVSHPSFVGTRTSAGRGPVADLVTTGTANVTITLDFSDEADDADITVPTPVILANAPATWPSVSVTNAGDFDAVRWVNRGVVVGGDATLPLSTAVHANRIGIHNLTLEVEVDDRTYSRVVNFTVQLLP